MAGRIVTGISSTHLNVDGKQLEIGFWPATSPKGTILLLHEALGSVSYWKTFPPVLAAATKHDVIAYSRSGHGDSQGPVETRGLPYYMRQVEVVIPAILAHFRVDAPVLYGHSEGAAIAFLYAAAEKSVRAVVAECPIIVQEPGMLETIRALETSYATSDLGVRLGRYHRDADAVFHSWIESTRSTLFTEYPMHQYLVEVTCPALVLQGSHDEFGGDRQFEAIQQSLPGAKHAVLDAGHLLHREDPERVAALVAEFLA